MKKINVVIPTYNRKNSVIRVLALLKRQVTEAVDLSLTVVIDGSTDGTLESVRTRFPDVTVIEGDGNWGWARCVNEGCKLAVKNRDDAVLLLNDHVRFHRNYLETLLKAVEKEPGAIIGSLSVSEEKQERITFSGVKKFRWWTGKRQPYHPFLTPYRKNLTGLHETIVLPGCGVMIPTEMFRKIGYFNETVRHRYKADYPFILRANKNNCKTLISWDAVISGDVKDKIPGSGLYRSYLCCKRFYPLWALPLLPLTVLILLFRELTLVIKGKKSESE